LQVWLQNCVNASTRTRPLLAQYSIECRFSSGCDETAETNLPISSVYGGEALCLIHYSTKAEPEVRLRRMKPELKFAFGACSSSVFLICGDSSAGLHSRGIENLPILERNEGVGKMQREDAILAAMRAGSAALSPRSREGCGKLIRRRGMALDWTPHWGLVRQCASVRSGPAASSSDRCTSSR
jgi:hypothetical protein